MYAILLNCFTISLKINEKNLIKLSFAKCTPSDYKVYTHVTTHEKYVEKKNNELLSLLWIVQF